MGTPRLISYVFPAQQVVAAPKFDENGRRDGTAVTVEIGISCISKADRVFGVLVSIKTNEDPGENAPYRFRVDVFGHFAFGDELSEDEYKLILHDAAVPLLIGAARERISDLSSRGPWGPFHLGFIAMPDRPSAQSTAPAMAIEDGETE